MLADSGTDMDRMYCKGAGASVGLVQRQRLPVQPCAGLFRGPLAISTRTGSRYSLVSLAVNSNVGCFVHSYVVVHNLRYNSGVLILFHARTFYPCVFGVFSMSPNLLEKWIWSVTMACIRTLDILLIFNAHLRLLTRNKPFDSFMSRDFVEAGPVRLYA